MNTLLIALGSITILYFLAAILKKTTESIIKIPVCSICIAVSATWLGLLIAHLLGYAADITVIAILMGGSVVGIMYKLEKIFEKNRLSNFWIVRLAVILFGCTAVFMLIAGKMQYLLMTGILAALFAASCAFFVKKENGEEKPKDGFLEKMKNCC